MLASTSAVWEPSLAYKTFDTMISLILTYHSEAWDGIIIKSECRSIGTLHRLKKVTVFLDAICKWITRLLILLAMLGCVRLRSIRNKNNWNNASQRLFGSYSHSGIPGFHSGYSAPRRRIAGIYSGIHSYSGIFPNERALSFAQSRPAARDGPAVHGPWPVTAQRSAAHDPRRPGGVPGGPVALPSPHFPQFFCPALNQREEVYFQRCKLF